MSINQISRAALLQSLGWHDRQDHEGILRWTKAEPDMLSFSTLSVAHKPDAIVATLDFEECDESFATQTRPLLKAVFEPRSEGSMRLVEFIVAGSQDTDPEGRIARCIEAFAEARAAMGPQKPKALLLGPMPSAHMGMKI